MGEARASVLVRRRVMRAWIDEYRYSEGGQRRLEGDVP
jgi:hypothetical protein